MQSITLHIPRRWRSDKVIHTIHPDNWEELRPSQFIALIRVMNGQISEDDLLVEMLDLPHNVVKKLDAYQRFRLGQLLQFMQSKAPFSRFVLKNIDGLKAPQDGLVDISFGEFIHMDTFYADYQESNTAEKLVSLVACLYVEYAKGETERPKFNGRIDVCSASAIPDIIQEAIALNYGLIRIWLEEAYPEVFPKQKKAANAGDGKNGNGWVDVYDTLVGDDLINAEKYFMMPCTEVLRYMNRKIIENRKKKKVN